MSLRDRAKRSSLVALALACKAPPEQGRGAGACPIAFSDTGEVRVFAMGHKLRMEEVETHEAWRASLSGRFARDVAPCLSLDRPNLVVYPEDVVLHAMALGSRGADARAGETSIDAVGALFGTYEAPIQFYSERFPDTPPIRRLLLGFTDTLWRALSGFGDIAREHGAWIMATGNVADATPTDDAAAVAALQDPDLPPGPVWLADTDDVWNQTILWGPDGEIFARRRKVYLTPPEMDLLQMSWGPPEALTPIETPFAKIGVVISKDAWMPDVLDRLAARGANLMVQPEAFSGWAIAETSQKKEWLPDVFKESSWSHVQKYAEARFNATPVLTGNLLDFVFDGQAHIVKDGAPGDDPMGFIGQDPDVGFSAVGPWVETDATAREDLRAVGESLLPGGARENEYVESLVAADLALGDFDAPDPGTDPRDTSVEVPHCTARPQVAVAGGSTYIACETQDGVALLRDGEVVREEPGRTPALAGDVMAWVDADADVRVGDARIASAGAWMPDLALGAGGDPVVVWAALDEGNTRVFAARGPDFAPVRVTARKPSAPDPIENEWAPSVAVAGDRVVVGFTAFWNYSWDVVLAESADGGASFADARRIDDAGDASERLHADVDLAFGRDGLLWAAWTDLRDRRPDTEVRFGAEPFDVLLWAPAQLGRPDWRPSLVPADDGVHVVWQEQREGTSDLVYKGGSLEMLVPLGLPGDQWSPRAAIGADGALRLVWEDSRGGRRHVRLLVAP